MIRTETFRISHGLYAVDLASLRITEHARENGSSYWGAAVDAVWFRRRRGTTVACIGYLWDYQDVEPADAETFLKAHDDGRYGGTTLGRWNGAGYWGNEDLDVQKTHLEILRPMLANYPAVPAGFDGWWRF